MLRALEDADLDELHRNLATPAVARWWRAHDRPSPDAWLTADGVILLAGELRGA